eukprot:3226227-Pyramimonas_sp.AAC.1
MTTREVYRHWNVVPFAIEATVQRLRSWQAAARAPHNHAYLVSTFFGDMRWEATCEDRCPPALRADGILNVP